MASGATLVRVNQSAHSRGRPVSNVLDEAEDTVSVTWSAHSSPVSYTHLTLPTN